jgi:hypothetical protein
MLNDIIKPASKNSKTSGDKSTMDLLAQIYFLPPLAVGRLGGSANPLDSYHWIEDPSLHGAGQTVIDPSITLQVLQDGSVRPFLPSSIQFRDGNVLRPVAPFLELWVKVQGSEELQPLTTALLVQTGATLESLSYTVTAANRKAARRTGDEACAYQASLRVIGDDHSPKRLLASSIGQNPLVFETAPIPLGTFQTIRPTPNGSELGVNLDTIRVRYTPAQGFVYGPPGVGRATEPETGRVFELVPAANRILNPASSWMRYDSDPRLFDSPQPADTYDGADDRNRQNLSFGVVDDTCDVVIEANLALTGQARLTAQARVFCGPPDYAPDRRPIVSLADDLIDRDPPRAETAESLEQALDRLGDLFQRVYETASLANVDAMRSRAVDGQPASQFPPATNEDSMSPRDPAFDKTQDLNAPPTTHERVPYASVARDVHAPLADVEDLALFLRGNAEKVRRLIRPPYGTFSDLHVTVDSAAAPDPGHRDPRNDRDQLFDMRMPPYMRDSDASPLSITKRQYRFLMSVLDMLQASAAEELTAAAAPPGAPAEPAALRTRVRDHVARVAARRAAPRRTQP